MLAQINSIQNVAKAEAVFNTLFASHAQRVGEKQATHNDRMVQRASERKVGGLAWWKDRCRAVVFNLVACDSKVSHFIPASPETQAWGGFLGGEHIHYTNKAAEADAEAMIAARVARA